MDADIVQTLLSFGISPRLRGFLFLYETLKHTVAHPDAAFMQGDSLYPPVLEALGVTYSRYERNIRHAIDRSWQLQDTNPNRKLFMYSNDNFPPTNSEFVAVVTVAHLTSMYENLIKDTDAEPNETATEPNAED